ncbi:hypothetical protein [Trichlorobacter lovleyi]|jgi:hypothetical protein|uniref:Uncharacterized protein n=1 Tax=Trichlorobacter lovleyi (strain ATCC BAA-1151 / DSM 17278 / SZ) TaxID=398767 RepID=B3E8R0_TRIL1|nr:hypothetical protein [Trichlorobacter lovleyi]ACD93763.1 conserved hypothetical protein [Trichlorobacter lovleyi SZ]
MARTAQETAQVLSEIYDESFANDSYEQFQLGWPELRSIAGVPKLTPSYLNQIGSHLRDMEMLLVVCDSFLLVARQQDLSHARSVPARLVEQHLPDFEDDEDLEIDEDELDDSGDDHQEDDDSF